VYRNLRWLGVPDAAVGDALQNVYVIALRHIESYVEGTHPKAWLYAIALHVASNHRCNDSVCR
jgi:RNA polymerase sigma-70 factor (ECF subfamily)